MSRVTIVPSRSAGADDFAVSEEARVSEGVPRFAWNPRAAVASRALCRVEGPPALTIVDLVLLLNMVFSSTAGSGMFCGVIQAVLYV